MKQHYILILVSAQIFNACGNDGTKDASPNSQNTIQPNLPNQTIIVTPTDFCGDGKLSINEVCDSELFSTPTSCDHYGYDTGIVKCTPNCSLDFSDCKKDNPTQENPITDTPVQEDPVDPIPNTPVCGDNIKEDGEDCDTQYAVGNCSQFGDFNKGEVFCSSTCTYNLSNCVKEVEPDPICGNGIRELGEECDDGNMDNTDMCTNSCTVRKCGDGILSQDEECDGDLFTITSCSDFNPNYDTGSLKCSSTCEIDTSDCSVSPKCGDGEINTASEECDGSVGSHTCGDIYTQFNGEVYCTACKLDYSGCVEVCPTNREFKPGQYTSGSLTFHIVDRYSRLYVVMDNKIGEFINDTTVQWTYSSVGDEGYYSYFNVGECDCNSCNISFNDTSYLNLEDVKSVVSKSMQYSSPTITYVPSYTIPSIDTPESIRTKNVYYSCNYRDCEDKNIYYLNITDKEFQVYGGSNIYYHFNLIKDLGDETYLVRYRYGYPKLEGMGDSPYAVIHISETNKYRVCDNFNVKDKVVTILSWSKYRDTAIGKVDFNSTDSYTYKYQVRYSSTSCDNSYDTAHLADIYLTEKSNRGKDLYKFTPNGYISTFYYNYCVSNTPGSGLFFYEKDLLGNNKEDDISAGYLSTYRDNVLVFDGTLVTYTSTSGELITDHPSSFYSMDNHGRYQYELVFPNKDYMDAYLKVNGSKQDISLIPSFTQNGNIEYDRWSHNNPIGLENETIVLCKVNLDDESRECKDMELSFSIKELDHLNFVDSTYKVFFNSNSGKCIRN